ncbi:MAG TPA: hypothetical protein VMX13_13845 [Sedimentisphaerales bacterium]|nr:hypothetical protein [Sedimentisphaerales bacterium]
MYTKMRTICIQIMIWCLLLGGFSQTAYGRSVYAITEHANSTITAYGIQGTAIQYQADVQAHWGSGAVGLALDPDSETLFVTYDGASKIQLIDAKRMVVEQEGAPAKKVRKVREQGTGFAHLDSG